MALPFILAGLGAAGMAAAPYLSRMAGPFAARAAPMAAGASDQARAAILAALLRAGPGASSAITGAAAKLPPGGLSSLGPLAANIARQGMQPGAAGDAVKAGVAGIRGRAAGAMANNPFEMPDFAGAFGRMGANVSQMNQSPWQSYGPTAAALGGLGLVGAGGNAFMNSQMQQSPGQGGGGGGSYSTAPTPASGGFTDPFGQVANGAQPGGQGRQLQFGQNSQGIGRVDANTSQPKQMRDDIVNQPNAEAFAMLLRERGISPTAGANPFVNHMMKNAPRMALSAKMEELQNPALLKQPGAANSTILDRALGGQGVFYDNAGAQQLIANARGPAEAAQYGGQDQDPVALLAAQLLYSPESAPLIASLLYGGVNGAGGDALRQGVLNQAAQGEYRGTHPDEYTSPKNPMGWLDVYQNSVRR